MFAIYKPCDLGQVLFLFFRLSFVCCKMGIITVLSAKRKLDNEIKALSSVLNSKCWAIFIIIKKWIAELCSLLEGSSEAKRGWSLQKIEADINFTVKIFTEHPPSWSTLWSYGLYSRSENKEPAQLTLLHAKVIHFYKRAHVELWAFRESACPLQQRWRWSEKA